MALQEHVAISITSANVGVTRLGFGVPLILSCNAAFSERVRSYNAIEDVAADFASTTPEYLAANALFSQSPAPQSIMIGRAVGKPTMRYKVTASTVENSHAYKLLVKGPGITETTATYTSDVTATDAEIAAGLVSALNAVVGKNFTASGSASPISITGDAVGNWFSVESLEPTYLKIEQDHAEPGTTLATDLTNIRAENDSWYALYTLYNSEAYVKAAAAAIEPLTKIYCADLSMSESATLASAGTGTSDPADDLKVLNYDRTFTVYHPSPISMNGAAFMGTRLPKAPGSSTWKYSQPVGQTPVNATATHTTNLVAKNVNFLQTTAGVAIMREGKMVGGEFIDVIRDLDYLKDDIQKSIFEALVSAGISVGKIPLTDAGIAIIETVLRGCLLRAVSLGIINPDFVVTVPRASSISTSNKGLRKLTNVKFSCSLQGAIHTVEVTGVISV